MLKMDDGGLVLNHMRRVLWLFIKIGGRQCSEYIRGMIIHINVLAHLERVNHPVWTMWKTNVSAFNEEAGELSFSVLARMTNANASRSDLKLANAKFRLIRTQLTTADDLECDLSRHQQGSRHHHQSLKVDCPDVLATAAHFQLVIRQMVANTFVVASDELVPQFKSNHKVPEGLVAVVGPDNATWIKDAETAASQLSDLTTKTMVATDSDFLTKLMHVWDPDLVQADVNLHQPASSEDDQDDIQQSAEDHSDMGMLSDEPPQLSDSGIEEAADQAVAALAGAALLAQVASSKRAALLAKQGPPKFNGSNRTAANKSKAARHQAQADPAGNALANNKRVRGGQPKTASQAKSAQVRARKAQKKKPAKQQASPSQSDVSCEEVAPPPAKPNPKKPRVTKARSSSHVVGAEASNNIIASGGEPQAVRRNQTRQKRQKVPFDDGGGAGDFEDFYGTADEEAQGLFEASD